MVKRIEQLLIKPKLEKYLYKFKDQLYLLSLILAYLIDQLEDKNATTQNDILDRITDYCGKPVTDPLKDDSEPYYKWTFYHAFFFAFTVCSTVGYGNISPTTTLGRMIMIVYSVIGIPVNGILFAGLGEYFGKTVRIFKLQIFITISLMFFLCSSNLYIIVIKSTKCPMTNIMCHLN